MPTPEQAEHLDGAIRAGRMVYNLALEVKRTAWQSARINISVFDLMRQLTELMNNEGGWLRKYCRESLESEINHLEKAYKSFFNGGGFPKFKSKLGRQSVEYRRGAKINGGKISFPKLGWVDFIEHRQFPTGQIRTTTVSRETTGKYFVSIMLKNDDPLPNKVPIVPETSIGVDVGLKSFATLSDGSKIDNPKYLAEQLKRLRIEQRKLARRFKRGQKEQSMGYYKQKLVVAKLHEKIRNKRTDFLQKHSTDLIRANNTICLETLNVNGMIKMPSIARAIGDVGWGEFIRMLKYKGEWYGKNIIEIGMFEPSSKMCSNCGFRHKELTLEDRDWDCTNCGAHHDRDVNAAINIKNIGLKAQPTIAKTGQQVESIGCELIAATTADAFQPDKKSKHMTTEDLLKPRYKVIALWPRCRAQVGDILIPSVVNAKACWVSIRPGNKSTGTFKDLHPPSNVVRGPEFYPHLFRKLEWHEHRKDNELPMYVKNKETGKAYRIAEPDQDMREWHVEGEIEHRHFKRWPNSFLPSTEEEFNSQKQTTNG